jgi:hypothetical protein
VLYYVVAIDSEKGPQSITTWLDIQSYGFLNAFSLNVSYYPLTYLLLGHTPLIPSSFHHLTYLILYYLLSSYYPVRNCIVDTDPILIR